MHNLKQNYLIILRDFKAISKNVSLSGRNLTVAAKNDSQYLSRKHKKSEDKFEVKKSVRERLEPNKN